MARDRKMRRLPTAASRVSEREREKGVTGALVFGLSRQEIEDESTVEEIRERLES